MPCGKKSNKLPYRKRRLKGRVLSNSDGTRMRNRQPKCDRGSAPDEGAWAKGGKMA